MPRAAAPVIDGIRRAIPVVFGYMPVGFAFGVLVVQNGMPAWMAVLMSIIVYAGSAQLIAANMLGAGFAPGSIVVTAFVVNLRHMLMAAALSPWLSGLPKPLLAAFGAELTDETFALHSRAAQNNEKARAATLLACNLTAHCAWVLATGLGAFSGELMGDTKTFGLDFALAAMFIALLVPYLRTRLYLLAGLVSALVSIALTLGGGGRVAVIIATVLTSCLGGWLLGRSGQGDELTARPLGDRAGAHRAGAQRAGTHRADVRQTDVHQADAPEPCANPDKKPMRVDTP